ncbi:MAG: hypothetical protein SGBAC_007005 [Bacillariaceae sp.]
MAALSGLKFGRSKSVPPELPYNMYGTEAEEEKIMEFSTENSITSKRSLTAGIPSQSHQQQSHQQQQQQQQQHLSEDQRMGVYQDRIKQIQNELANPPMKQIQIDPQYTQHPLYQQIQHGKQHQQPQQQPAPPMRHQLPSATNPRSKTPEPMRSRDFMDHFRSKTPEPRTTSASTPPSRSSSVPATTTRTTTTTVLRTQRYHAEKIVTPDGNIMLKKKIVHVNRTRCCAACGFREWSVDDMAFLLVRQSNKTNKPVSAENTEQSQQQQQQQQQPQIKWLCPDCACDNGLPKEHYHFNVNRLPPIADPVNDITMNRPIGPVDADDVVWVQKAQQRPKAQNWKSQYSDYYKDIRRKQFKKQAMCCAPPPPEEYSDSPEDDIRRAVANACYAPNYEESNVGETCYSYVGDL